MTEWFEVIHYYNTTKYTQKFTDEKLAREFYESEKKSSHATSLSLHYKASDILAEVTLGTGGK